MSKDSEVPQEAPLEKMSLGHGHLDTGTAELACIENTPSPSLEILGHWNEFRHI